MHAPAAESLPWPAQGAADDAAHRAQLAYLYERSPFYRRKLAAAEFPEPGSAGGVADVARLAFTEKDELRVSRTPDNPIGAHLAAGPGDIARISRRLRETLVVATAIELAPFATLPRSDYKSKLVDWSGAT